MQKHMIRSLIHFIRFKPKLHYFCLWHFAQKGHDFKNVGRLPDVGLDMEAAAGFRFLLMSLEHGGPR